MELINLSFARRAKMSSWKRYRTHLFVFLWLSVRARYQLHPWITLIQWKLYYWWHRTLSQGHYKLFYSVSSGHSSIVIKPVLCVQSKVLFSSQLQTKHHDYAPLEQSQLNTREDFLIPGSYLLELFFIEKIKKLKFYSL